ncbi:Tex family protein [Salinarimonas rosea]|uniref:Tex family protein n=1 Tax=Salinarimonas rosea TaxID=552063 RepID=UPI00040158C3|nr:Tex family protein [Salinarimonas rosea]
MTKTNAGDTARTIIRGIAAELGVADAQVAAAVTLLDEGATVPFVARYRKEATGGLDDAQLRTLEERLGYLRELEDRRAAIRAAIAEQGKLTDALAAAIAAADTKARLEDLYLPYKTKRRTKAQIAREAGLGPLAEALMASPERAPEDQARAFVDAGKGVADVDAALEGARHILVERFAEDADLIGRLREDFWREARLVATVREGKEQAGAKFSDYFGYSGKIADLPAHRILAIFRAEKEEVLSVSLTEIPENAPDTAKDAYPAKIRAHFRLADRGRPGDAWLGRAAGFAWRTKISLSVALDARARLWAKAEEESIRVFAANLRDLLLAAPAGARATMGLDPGFRTGVKVAVVDATGKVVATDTIYPHEPQRRWDAALHALEALVRRHDVELIAIGNGTASRETDKLAGELVARLTDRKATKVMVSEAGASVYSASAFASKELPDLDVSLRGAVSIARRLQDPLAELVKIDPKSIGVGQYQHDLAEHALSRALDAVVEDCVNAVGVEVNTASAPLLARVSGLGEGVAKAIVARRDEAGPFRTRKELMKVPGLGPKTFQLAAGFLRIQDGADPLDRSGVHPEAYPVVRRILEFTEADVVRIIGDTKTLRALDPRRFTDETFGVPTVSDIIAELEKPGRDPRPAFKTASFAEGVEKISDLRPGMVLEGVVTNVAAFGAFVDIGVHQDGLVHVSAMSTSFVKDPRAVAKPGDVVKVKVMEVDVPRKRIGLSMRLSDEPGQERRPAQKAGGGRGEAPRGERRDDTRGKPPAERGAPAGGALAEALRRARERDRR